MGNGNVKPVAPPYEQYLWIQDPSDNPFCGRSVGEVWEPHVVLDPGARSSGVHDVAFQALVSEVGEHVTHYRKEAAAIRLLFAAVVVGQVLAFGMKTMREEDGETSLLSEIIPVVFAVCAIINLLTVEPANQKVDARIDEAVRRAAGALGPGVTAEYKTKWTGMCKPKHHNTSRYIALGWVGLTPPGEVLQGQVVQGQVIQGQVLSPASSSGVVEFAPLYSATKGDSAV